MASASLGSARYKIVYGIRARGHRSDPRYDYKTGHGDDGVGAAAYDDFENVNLAHEPARRAQVQALAARLRAQFERAPGC